MADGTITFSTALDNKQLEKELQSTLKKINSLEKSISEMGSGRNALAEQAKEMGAQLDAAKQKLYEMQSAAKGVYSKETIADQKTLVNGLQSEWNKINSRVDSYDQKIKNATARLSDEKEHYSEISEQIDKANGKSGKMQDSIERVGASVEKIWNRIKNLFRRVLFFSVLTSAFRSFRTWLGNVIQSNSEAAASIAQLKGALLTLAQPIVEVIIPAFTALVNIVTKVVTALAALVSWIFGKTISQSKEAAKNLNKETKALGGVGAAANEAKRQLAAFDEINQLVQETSSGGGGGSSTDASFDFDETSFLKNLPNWLKNLAADLQIKIKNLKFDWDRGNIMHNKDAWIIALSGILGAVLGGMFGGLHGAVIGLLLGAAIGLIGCTLLDKTSNPE